MKEYDLLVIGSGPGGYVAAIRASQLGLSTAIIERDKIGGVCLNIGCIPSKSLIEQATGFSSLLKMKDYNIKVDTRDFDYSKVLKKSREAAENLSKGVSYLLKKNKIELIKGSASFKDRNIIAIDNKEELRGKKILIATGSTPVEIPGFDFDGKQVISSNEALMLEKLPESIIIMGSGAIGMEFAYIYNSFGVKVTIVEMMDRPLPREDGEISEAMMKIFSNKGIKIETSTRAMEIKKSDNSIKILCENKVKEKIEIEGEKLLVAVGRKPVTEGLNLQTVGIKPDKKGFIPVGDYYETGVSGIYAIGDVIDSPMLAHVASKEGEIAVEHMAAKPVDKKLDGDLIPGAVYTEPQVASFGITEESGKERGIKYNKAQFTYRGAGKAVAVERAEGFVKVLYDPDSHEIVGAHIIGAEATELIHQLLLAKKAELLPEDLATMVHAHPTFSEIVMEVNRAVEGWVIHN